MVTVEIVRIIPSDGSAERLVPKKDAIMLHGRNTSRMRSLKEERV
jgi:hypothetical protein